MKHSALSAVLCSIVLSLSCGPNSARAVSFDYSDFSSTTNLNLVGNTAQVGNVLRLTDSSPDHAGAAWHTMKHDVAGGFETVFNFRISDLGQNNFGELGGDGFAFVIQNASSTALTEMGDAGFYMGYEIENSLAVEFDTFYNHWWSTPDAWEPNGNHVGVQSNGPGVNTASYMSGTEGAYLGAAAVSPNMSDGSVHTAKIIYAPGTLEIFIDDFTNAALAITLDLDTLLDLDGGTAYVGFTAGGDTAYENHDLLSWEFDSNGTAPVPEPSTVLLLGTGLIGLVGARRRLHK